MKRLFLMLCIVSLFLCGCAVEKAPTDKLSVVTTIFPPYDFAREITGDNAEITMLLRPGAESHTYDPSPADILKISSCDVFIYNGGESDSWVGEILSSVELKDGQVIRMMDCVETVYEETVEGMQVGHEHHESEEEEYDEHVWTAPQNAVAITKAIADAICKADPDNELVYRENTENYCDKLKELDEQITEIVDSGVRKELMFGDRFPFRYFADAYGLEYYAAFSGCAPESEPSAKTLSGLIDRVNEDSIPVVFYIEMSSQKIAKTVSEATGTQLLLFHSCHNLTRDEFGRGETYLSLMKQNAENLKKAIS